METYRACLEKEKGRRHKHKNALCAEGYCTAKNTFKSYPSAYANGYAVQVCQGKKPAYDDQSGGGGLTRWFAEDWVNVCETRKDGTHPPCGRKKHAATSHDYPYCRPRQRVKGSGRSKTADEMSVQEKEAMCEAKKRSLKSGARVREQIKPTTQSGSGHTPNMDYVARYNKLKHKQREVKYRGQTVTLYRPQLSDKGKKKLFVFVEDPQKKNRIHKVFFGHDDYEDFTIHRDKKRQENYCARSGGIECGDEPPPYCVTSANFWSRMVLWNCPTIK